MSSGVAGHGALIAIEKDGDPGGTFTNIAEQTAEQSIEFFRRMAEITPHNDTIDAHIPGVMSRSPVTTGGNFIYNNATHDELTGLQKRWIDGDKFGVRWRGPAGAAATDEIIASAHISNFRRIAPSRTGEYRFEVTFQLSGPMIIDSVTVGAVG